MFKKRKAMGYSNFSEPGVRAVTSLPKVLREDFDRGGITAVFSHRAITMAQDSATMHATTAALIAMKAVVNDAYLAKSFTTTDQVTDDMRMVLRGAG